MFKVHNLKGIKLVLCVRYIDNIFFEYLDNILNFFPIKFLCMKTLLRNRGWSTTQVLVFLLIAHAVLRKNVRNLCFYDFS